MSDLNDLVYAIDGVYSDAPEKEKYIEVIEKLEPDKKPVDSNAPYGEIQNEFFDAILDNWEAEKGYIANAYDVAESMGATMPAEETSANLANTIETIPQGGGSVKEKDVNFYDYDGTLLYSYTAEEAGTLSALPNMPTHEGLTAQEWNYTLEQVKSYADNGYSLNVGATYITTDGSTKLFLHVNAKAKIPKIRINLTMDANSSSIIDWGDGTTETVNNNTNSAKEVYGEKNDYAFVNTDSVICIRIVGGSFWLGKYSSFSSGLFDGGNIPVLFKVCLGENCYGIGYQAFCECATLRFATIPHGVVALESPFKYSGLEAIVIPRGITSFGHCVDDCDGLKLFIMPQDITIIADYAFRDCRKLTPIIIPNITSTIGDSSFCRCKSLTSIVIPLSVTTIKENAFGDCYNLSCVDLSAFTSLSDIPTLYSSNAFYNNVDRFLVYDSTMLAAFSSATNWSDYASKYVVKE